MRIFMVCDALLDGKDAQTTHVIELLRNLKRRNNVICFAPKPKNARYEFQEITYVPALNKPVFLSISCQLSLFFYLIYFCIKARPDAIYTRQSGVSFSPLITSQLFRIPYFVEITGLIWEEMKLLKIPKWRIVIAKLNEKLDYKHAKKIIAVTQALKEVIKKIYNIPAKKIIVIENGANTDLFKPINPKNARNELKLLSKNSYYIGFIGSLSPWQGVEYLVQSVPHVLKRFPNTKFLIVGDGPMGKEWVQLAYELGVSDKFVFAGNVPYERVPMYINASDICVAPFIKERNIKIGLSPLKIYEYLACGKPVVSSRIPNLEFLELNNAGILVEPEKTEELAKVIIKLLKDEKLREEMGRNGRKCVVKNHSWESVARRVAEVCERAVMEHKK